MCQKRRCAPNVSSSVYNLPADFPDYNPIKKLWKKIKQKHLHLQDLPTFDALKDKVNEALCFFENASKEVPSLCGFHELPGCLVAGPKNSL